MEDERELIARARAGDGDAHRRLYDLHLGTVWRLALRLTQRRELAEDCVQETFVKAFASLDRFRGETAFAGWLYRIAYRAAIDLLRRERPRRVEPLSEAHEAPAEPVLGDPLLRRRLLAALSALDEIYRDVFVLFHFGGTTHAGIARRLAIPEGTSKRRLSVAHARMRIALEEHQP